MHIGFCDNNNRFAKMWTDKFYKPFVGLNKFVPEKFTSEDKFIGNSKFVLCICSIRPIFVQFSVPVFKRFERSKDSYIALDGFFQQKS